MGVSRDPVDSHQRFKEKYGIPFMLVADTGSLLCDAFGVVSDNKLQRSTFLIDAGGTIKKVWPKVSVEGHAQEVLSSIS